MEVVRPLGKRSARSGMEAHLPAGNDEHGEKVALFTSRGSAFVHGALVATYTAPCPRSRVFANRTSYVTLVTSGKEHSKANNSSGIALYSLFAHWLQTDKQASTSARLRCGKKKKKKGRARSSRWPARGGQAREKAAEMLANRAPKEDRRPGFHGMLREQERRAPKGQGRRGESARRSYARLPRKRESKAIGYRAAATSARDLLKMQSCARMHGRQFWRTSSLGRDRKPRAPRKKPGRTVHIRDPYLVSVKVVETCQRTRILLHVGDSRKCGQALLN